MTRDSTCRTGAGIARMLVLTSLGLGAVGALAAQASAVITPQGSGPYHRLVLPAAVYQNAAFADLRDLRIHNRSGVAVPYAWLQSADPAPQTASQQVPLFAVPEPVAQNQPTDTLAAFKVRSDGSLVLERPVASAARGIAPSTAQNTLRNTSQWLMDVSQIKGRLLQAHFSVAVGTQGMFAFRLEQSDDLRQWQPVGTTAPEQLVVLRQDGQQVERLSVDLHNVQTRFLRLKWQDPQHRARLTGVTVDSVQDTWQTPVLEWSEPIKAQDCAADHCDYVLPPGVPAHSLRIHLADTNTLAPLRVAGVAGVAAPATRGAAQHPVAHNPLYALRRIRKHTPAKPAPQEVALLDTVVYRLTLDGREVVSPELPLDGRVYHRLRLYTQGAIAALGPTPPTVELATPQRALVFLAQGDAPFSLQWDTTPSADAMNSALRLEALLPGGVTPSMGTATLTWPAAAEGAPHESPTTVGTSAPATDASNPQKWWLWGALLLGLAVLGAMAASLFKNLKPSADDATKDAQGG